MWTQLPPEQRAHPLPPSFWPKFIVAKGWMDEDATWYGSRPRPRPHCIRRDPSSAQNGHSSPPPIISAHVYYGHGIPSQLLLSSCLITEPSEIQCSVRLVFHQFSIFQLPHISIMSPYCTAVHGPVTSAVFIVTPVFTRATLASAGISCRRVSV